MSLQSACAARLAARESHGTAMGCLMGSVALRLVLYPFPLYHTRLGSNMISVRFLEPRLVVSLLGLMVILLSQCTPVHPLLLARS